MSATSLKVTVDLESPLLDALRSDPRITGEVGPAGPAGLDGADGNVITLAVAAPTTPAVGDVWVDTSS